MIPITDQAGFRTDANGNGNIGHIIKTSHWVSVYATCQCPGGGAWVSGQQGQDQFFGTGANTVMGPLVLRANQTAQIAVFGATPNSQVDIAFHGWQSDLVDGSDLAPVSSAISSVASLPLTFPLSITGNILTTARDPSVWTPTLQLLTVTSTPNTVNGLIINTPSGLAPTTASGIISNLGPTYIQVNDHLTGIPLFFLDQNDIFKSESPFLFDLLSPTGTPCNVTIWFNNF